MKYPKSEHHVEAMLRNREIVGDCWLYTKTRDKDGYGVMQIGDDRRRVHRLACEWLRGEAITDERPWVLHTCDNPACFNPEHLRTGTHAENVADREARGRNRPPKGERHPMAKLSDADIKAIYAELAEGTSRRELAARYGVRIATICKYANGQRRKDCLT